jgi:hypothetical protein
LADNTTLSAGSGGDVIATDDLTSLNGGVVSGVKVQRVKVGFGLDGAFRDVESLNPLPTFGPDVTGSGNITTTDSVGTAPLGAGALINAASTSTSIVSIAAGGGDCAWNLQITGTWTGTIYFEISLDSTTGIDGNWVSCNGRQSGVVNTILSNSTTTNGVYRGNTSGAKYYRVRAVGAWSGTAACVIRLSDGVGAVFLNASVPAGTNAIGTVAQAAITKGTQGTTGVTTQDLKDAGRVNVAITLYQGAGILTTEALFSTTPGFSRSADGAAATTAQQQFTVTAGKRFRIQSIMVSLKQTGAVATTAKLALRYAAAGGTIATTSPILALWDMGSNNATAANYVGPVALPLPDGVELLPASTFGFTSLASAVTVLHTITLTGYEY